MRAGELHGPGVRSMIAGNVFAAAARAHVVRWFGNPDLPLTLVGDFASTLAAVGMHDSGQSRHNRWRAVTACAMCPSADLAFTGAATPTIDQRG